MNYFPKDSNMSNHSRQFFLKAQYIIIRIPYKCFWHLNLHSRKFLFYPQNPWLLWIKFHFSPFQMVQNQRSTLIERFTDHTWYPSCTLQDYHLLTDSEVYSNYQFAPQSRNSFEIALLVHFHFKIIYGKISPFHLFQYFTIKISFYCELV